MVKKISRVLAEISHRDTRIMVQWCYYTCVLFAMRSVTERTIV